MKRIFFLLFMLLISCNKEKVYYEVIIYDETELNNQITRVEDIDTIKVLNDTLALESVYRSFCISELLHKEYLANDIPSYNKPIDYYLLNDKKEKVFNFLDTNKKIEIYKNIEKDIKGSLNFKDNSISKPQSNYLDSDNVCLTSEDFIKQDLYNPATADFSMFDCSTEKNADGSYTILRKVTAQNSFGVEKEFIYKLTIGFKGGNWVDISNWDLLNIKSEEYR